MKTFPTFVACAALLIAAMGFAEANTPQGFIEEGIQGDNSEVMMGELAVKNGASTGVKDFCAFHKNGTAVSLIPGHCFAKSRTS